MKQVYSMLMELVYVLTVLHLGVAECKYYNNMLLK